MTVCIVQVYMFSMTASFTCILGLELSTVDNKVSGVENFSNSNLVTKCNDLIPNRTV